MTCRICGSEKLYQFLSLGTMPIPNGFLSNPHEKEVWYPLGVCVCQDCWLVQLTHIIPPGIMFKNYLYIPSTSSTMTQHFKSLAEDAIMRFNLTSKDLVVDIGSNDGTLLGYFKEHEVKILGIDPATNLVTIANLKGIETKDAYFTREYAIKVREEKGRAKVITATNVLAHVNDLDDLCEGVKELLDKDGVFICECPYLIDLLDRNEFDTIYHEHLSYFSLYPLIRLFKKHGMTIFDIQKLSVHGGSVRVYVKFKAQQSKRLTEFLGMEKIRKLDKLSTYEEFGRRVKVIKRDLNNYLKRLKLQDKKIVGYGASAKGNVLLNYCKIDTKLLDYIVDSISYKQGKFTPGTHIPIYPERRLLKDQPDYVLLLAWNFADEILKKQIKYRERGGQFIITIPYLRTE